MRLSLTPELQQFIDAKVRAGEYGSPEELLEAAVARLMLDTNPAPDEETLRAIEEGEAQLDRGEGIAVQEAFDRLRAKHTGR